MHHNPRCCCWWWIANNIADEGICALAHAARPLARLRPLLALGTLPPLVRQYHAVFSRTVDLPVGHSKGNRYGPVGRAALASMQAHRPNVGVSAV